MNKYEICGGESCEDDPNHRMEKIIGQVVPKIERVVSDAKSLDEETMNKVGRIIEKTKDKHEIELDREDLLRMAFESIAERGGGLQERHQEEYEELLVESIVNDIDEKGEEELYEILKERLGSLKEKNISVDGKEIERRVVELFDTQKEVVDE